MASPAHHSKPTSGGGSFGSRAHTPSSDIFSTVVFKSGEVSPYGTVVHDPTPLPDDAFSTMLVHKVEDESFRPRGERSSNATGTSSGGTLKIPQQQRSNSNASRASAPPAAEPLLWEGQERRPPPPSVVNAAGHDAKERARQRNLRDRVHETVTHEDPSLKYDLLNELGMLCTLPSHAAGWLSTISSFCLLRQQQVSKIALFPGHLNAGHLLIDKVFVVIIEYSKNWICCSALDISD
jgi:hypothetical protein